MRVPRGPGQAGAPQEVAVDSIPPGEVDVRRDLTVCATDGEIGQAQGLVVEPAGHHVTHVLLQERHLWGRKEVAIPISAVTKIGTLLIHLSLTRHQVEDLPPVDIEHPADKGPSARKPDQTTRQNHQSWIAPVIHAVSASGTPNGGSARVAAARADYAARRGLSHNSVTAGCGLHRYIPN